MRSFMFRAVRFGGFLFALVMSMGAGSRVTTSMH